MVVVEVAVVIVIVCSSNNDNSYDDINEIIIVVVIIIIIIINNKLYFTRGAPVSDRLLGIWRFDQNQHTASISLNFGTCNPANSRIFVTRNNVSLQHRNL